MTTQLPLPIVEQEPKGTYGITGIIPPEGITSKTRKIPFAPDMPVRREISSLYTTPPPDLKEGEVSILPIDVWTEEHRQWTLYVHALARFKAREVDQRLSYFQVAGIHGYPETSWDGADPPPKDHTPGKDVDPGANPFGGYCEHNTIAFPTWHRPYMLLFEQVLHEIMEREVIPAWKFSLSSNWPGNSEKDWINSVLIFRLPYWDWARKQTYNHKFSLPEVLTLPQVWVRPPSGWEIVMNPLWEFENPQKDASHEPLPFGQMPERMKAWNIRSDYVDATIKDKEERDAVKNIIPWDKCARTGRYGIFLDQKKSRYIGIEGINNFTSANTELEEVPWYPQSDKLKHKFPMTPGTLSDAVNRLFCDNYAPNWGTFASTKWVREAEATEYLSLEYIHNNIHNIAGGVDFVSGMGHLSDVPVAAFDPVFWLHHCNIDRLTAMWQVTHWDAWWDTKESGTGNVADKKETDPLQPFHKIHGGDPKDAKDNVWTSQQVRDWTTLGYQYDDLVPLPIVIEKNGELNETAYIYQIKDTIQSEYSSTKEVVAKVMADPSIRTPIGLDESKSTWNDYLLNVEYDRYALNGRSYSIVFFLGGNRNDPYEMCSKRYIIGRIYTFSAGTASQDSAGCANCTSQKSAGVMSRAQVPITIRLLQDAVDQNISFSTMTHKEVKKYIQRKLYWKFVAYGGSEIHPQGFDKTKVILHGGGGGASDATQSKYSKALGKSKIMAQDGGKPVVAAPLVNSILSSFGGYKELLVSEPGKASFPLTED